MKIQVFPPFFTLLHTATPLLIPNKLIRFASVYSFISISSSAFTFGFSGQNMKLNRHQVRQQSATRCDFRSSFRFLPSFSPPFSFAIASLIALGRWLDEGRGGGGSCAVAPVGLSVSGQRFCEIEPQVSQRELFSLSICKRFVTSFRTNLSGKTFSNVKLI